jgi:hypothetical protein
MGTSVDGAVFSALHRRGALTERDSSLTAARDLFTAPQRR